MSWFRKSTPPEELSIHEQFLAEAEEKIGKYLDQEETSLRSFDLPIPKMKGIAAQDSLKNSFRSFNSAGEVVIQIPTFELPPHLVFKVLRISSVDKLDDKRQLPLQAHATYVTLGDEQTINDIEKVFRTGLHKVVANFPGKWFNRDPYGLYKYFNEIHGNEAAQFLTELIYKFLYPPPIPLEVIAGYEPEELSLMLSRTHFFQILASGCLALRYPLYANIREKPEPIFTDTPTNILFNLPFPLAATPDNYITLKILPNQDTRPAVADSFLDSLRNVAHPFAFELIAEAGTMYFQLNYANQE